MLNMCTDTVTVCLSFPSLQPHTRCSQTFPPLPITRLSRPSAHLFPPPSPALRLPVTSSPASHSLIIHSPHIPVHLSCSLVRLSKLLCCSCLWFLNVKYYTVKYWHWKAVKTKLICNLKHLHFSIVRPIFTRMSWRLNPQITKSVPTQHLTKAFYTLTYTGRWSLLQETSFEKTKVIYILLCVTWIQ